MTKESITIDREEWKRMYAIQIYMEQYFSYKNDSRKVIAKMAPLFLDDVEKMLAEQLKDVSSVQASKILKELLK